MDGKNDGHPRTRPARERNSPQKRKEKDRCQPVEKYADQMMPAARHSEDLAIEHVGESSNWKPICRFGRCERPEDPGDGDAVAHVGIRADIVRVVEVYEVEVAC